MPRLARLSLAALLLSPLAATLWLGGSAGLETRVSAASPSRMLGPNNPPVIDTNGDGLASAGDQTVGVSRSGNNITVASPWDCTPGDGDNVFGLSSPNVDGRFQTVRRQSDGGGSQVVTITGFFANGSPSTFAFTETKTRGIRVGTGRLLDDNKDGVIDGISGVEGVTDGQRLAAPVSFSLSLVQSDTNGDGNPDYLSFPWSQASAVGVNTSDSCGPGGKDPQVWLPLADTNSDGVNDGLVFDLDGDNTADADLFMGQGLGRASGQTRFIGPNFPVIIDTSGDGRPTPGVDLPLVPELAGSTLYIHSPWNANPNDTDHRISLTDTLGGGKYTRGTRTNGAFTQEVTLTPFSGNLPTGFSFRQTGPRNRTGSANLVDRNADGVFDGIVGTEVGGGGVAVSLSLILADVTGDSKPDYISLPWSQASLFGVNTKDSIGPGGKDPQIYLPLADTNGDGAGDALVLDLNGDGVPDPLFYSSPPLGQGPNGFATATTITSDLPDPSAVGQAVIVSWTVTVVAPGVGTPTGTVTVTSTTGETCSATVATGRCTLAFATAGARTLTATYGGDETYSSSAGTAPHQAVCPSITVGPASVPGGRRGIAYAATFTASGGTAPYAFALSAGSVPPGLALTGSTLSGTPTTAGSFALTVTATDASSCTGSQAYILPVDQLTLGFGEGAFGPAFSSFLTILNPNATAVPTELAFQFEAGTEVNKTTTVPASSRVTIPLANAATLPDGTQVPPPTALSATVTSTSGRPLVAEESTYFSEGSAFTGGTRIVARAPSTTHYFAEGTEKLADFGSGPVNFFDTYLLLGNDNTTPASLSVKFLREAPFAPLTQALVVPANARLTVPIQNAVPSLTGESFGMVITSDVPVSATRSTYFGMPPTYFEAHASEGVAVPSLTHLFAEGTTMSGFSVFFIVANPGTTAAAVTLTHHLVKGGTVVQTVTVPGESRAEVYANGAPGDSMSGVEFWTSATSTQPVAIERSMYLLGAVPRYWGMGTSSPGLAQPATKLAFAEGVVGLSPAFQTFLLVANPSATQALALDATYVKENGTTVVKSYTVPAGGRTTVWVNAQVPELADQGFGVILEATNGVPFVAEESVYWNRFTGGATTVGTAVP